MTGTERGLVLVAGLFVTVACIGWYTSVRHPEPLAWSNAGEVTDVGVAPADSIDASARNVVETDPFRLERRPSSIVYQPTLEGTTPPPKPPKPQLVLEGLVGSSALIDGAPGHPVTAMVHAGDTIGGLRIRRVGHDTVVVTGADTTWRLTLRQSWQ